MHAGDLAKAVSWLTGKTEESLKSLKELAFWVWEVLQGDFNQEQDVSHIAANVGVSVAVTATGIGVIVAWLMDLRDLIANATHIYRAARGGQGAEKTEGEATAAAAGLDFNRVPVVLWVALIATLVGAIPAVGDLVKGVFRIVLVFFKRAVRAMPGQASAARLMSTAIADAMPALRELLARPMVQTYLTGRGWRRPFHELAKAFRSMKTLATHARIMRQFDDLVDKLNTVIGMVHRFLPGGAGEKIVALNRALNEVRAGLNAAAARSLRPFQDSLDAIIRRLEWEDLAAFGARTGELGSHYYGRIQPGTQAWRAIRHEPYLIRVADGEKPPFQPTSYADNKTVIDRELANGFPRINIKEFATFHRVYPDILKARRKPIRLYRVVDPKTHPNGLYWMDEDTFTRLASRADWRDRCAVKHEWNANGQVVVYTVPPGHALKVWRGPAASQPYDGDLWYRGGGDQIVFVPDPAYVSPRHPTQWGYVDNNEQLAGDRIMIDLASGAELKTPPPPPPPSPPPP